MTELYYCFKFLLTFNVQNIFFLQFNISIFGIFHLVQLPQQPLTSSLLNHSEIPRKTPSHCTNSRSGWHFLTDSSCIAHIPTRPVRKWTRSIFRCDTRVLRNLCRSQTLSTCPAPLWLRNEHIYRIASLRFFAVQLCCFQTKDKKIKWAFSSLNCDNDKHQKKEDWWSDNVR